MYCTVHVVCVCVCLWGSLRLGSNIGAYASGSRHLATVSVMGLEREKEIILLKIMKWLSPFPLLLLYPGLSLPSSPPTPYPGCCTISLRVLTASSLLIFSKLISLTCSNMSPVSILPSAATAPLQDHVTITWRVGGVWLTLSLRFQHKSLRLRRHLHVQLY